MGIFSRKKKDEEQPNVYYPDRQTHRIFQIGAFLLMLYIAYSLFFGAGEDIAGQNLNDEQINEKVKIAFEKMASTTEYKKLKDFVLYVDSSADHEKGSVLDVPEGVLIFIPKKLVDGVGKDSLEVTGDELKVKVSVEKLSSDKGESHNKTEDKPEADPK